MMTKKINLLFGLFFIGLLLTGCQRPLNTKQQAKDDIATIIKLTAKQQTELTTLESDGQGVPANYLKLQKNYPDENLLTVSTTSVAKLSKRRATAYSQLKADQQTLKPIINRLTKLAKHDENEFPVEAIKDLNQSLSISSLDHTTLFKFYTETTAAEEKFYSTHTDATASNDSLDAPIGRLNQYYSSIYQQAEITKVNIHTVTAQAKKVQTSLQ